MRNNILKIFFAICIVILCLAMSACSPYKIEEGYSYIGKIPSMFVGMQTNKTEYPIDGVSLEIAYGWTQGFVDESGQEGYETYSVLIVAYDWTVNESELYTEPTTNYDTYFSAENFCVLKEIGREDFSNEQYIASTATPFLKAKVEYNTKETFRIPQELFENITDTHSSVHLGIVLIGYSESDNTYKAIYSNNITVRCEVSDGGIVKIMD